MESELSMNEIRGPNMFFKMMFVGFFSGVISIFANYMDEILIEKWN